MDHLYQTPTPEPADVHRGPLYQRMARYGFSKALVWKSPRDEVIKAWEIGLRDPRPRPADREGLA
jgi:hypothetical protein